MLGAAPVHGKSDQIRLAPVPDWVVPSELLAVPADASGLMYVRRNDALVHLHEDGQSQYTAYRVKLLHPNALQLGNLAIAWNPAAGSPAVHMVRIHRQNEEIDVLRSVSFEILRREDQLEASHIDGILTAVLKIPDLRVGDELEVAMTVPGNDPTLKGTSAGLLLLAASPSPGRFRLGLNWVDGQEPHLRLSPDLAPLAKRGQRTVTIDLDNPATLAPPKDAPPRFKWQRVIEFSDFADWPELSSRFAPLFAEASALPTNSPLRAEVRRIASTHPRPLDRARAALELVQQHVRYIYVGLNGGNLTPASAEETWQRRYGDCKGKTALLLGLLSELGIKAEPVLASNIGLDDGLDARLPNPSLFDHVLVRAHIDGVDYWLDGTLPAVAGPSAKPVMPYRWILPVTSHGSSPEQIKWQAPETPDEITLFEIDARAGFDAPARITNTMVVRGIKGLTQQVQLSGLTSAQLLDAMRQELIGSTWQSVDDVRWHYDAETQASVLTIRGAGAVDWEDGGGGVKSLRLPGGGFNPPEKRIRSAEQDQTVPFYNEDPKYSCHVTTVRLPNATKTSNWSFNTSFENRLFGRNFYRAFTKRDGEISMIRGSRVEQLEIDAATARGDNARVSAFDNSMAVITYDPASSSASESKSFVPATYEFDWTSVDVPCLASSTDPLRNTPPASRE